MSSISSAMVTCACSGRWIQMPVFMLNSGFVHIRESPGILLFRIPGPGKSWKRA